MLKNIFVVSNFAFSIKEVEVCFRTSPRYEDIVKKGKWGILSWRRMPHFLKLQAREKGRAPEWRRGTSSEERISRLLFS
jgi:hypothetical protein